MVGDWKASGDALLTIDTTQGLEFLDLTESTNRSVADVSSQFGAGGDYEGFRYATSEEVVNLINEIGWSGSPALVSTGFNTSLQTFDANTEATDILDLLGGTFSNADIKAAANGLTSDMQGSDFHIAFVIDDFQNNFDFAGIGSSDGTANSAIGSFLVRAQGSSPPPGGGGVVPEPSSFAMFALAGVGLVGARRRES